MGRPGIKRAIAIVAVTCLAAVVVACGGLGLAVHQGVVTPAELDLRVGALHIVTQAPHEIICPDRADQLTLQCYRYKAASLYLPSDYKIWVFIQTTQQRARSSRVLVQLRLPLRPPDQ
jgi:hypothetical protein